MSCLRQSKGLVSQETVGSVGGEGGEITRQFGFIDQVDDVNWPANHLGYLDISLYSVDQSGDCVVIPENAQGEETINFSYEIIVLDIYFSPNSLSK